MIVHWIEQNVLNRGSTAIACVRFQGRLTHEKIAAAVSNIHAKYGVDGKVIKTCTDNGANIVKAFREYGSDLPGISSTGSTEQGTHSIQTSIRSHTRAEEGNDNDIEGKDLDFGNDNTADAETESSEEYMSHNDQTREIVLPSQMPCCTHALKLCCHLTYHVAHIF